MTRRASSRLRQRSPAAPTISWWDGRSRRPRIPSRCSRR
jgi:hypothetical protein